MKRNYSKLKDKGKYYFLLQLFLIALMSSQASWGQIQKQVIGSYPVMDGGFEGQVPGALALGGDTAPHATNWTHGGSVVANVVNTSATARSGNNCLSYNIASGGRYMQSPQAVPSYDLNTSYVIQFYYKSATAGDVRGTLYATTKSVSAVTLNPPFTANTWLKASVVRPSGAGPLLPNNWAGIRDGVTGTPVAGIIDDFVIYQGSVIDVTAPDPVTAPLVAVNGAALDVSWTAPVAGVDGGGYIVVRYDESPNADNDPNVNGIYAIGNLITNGTGALSGKVVYIGTATSFQDASVVSNTNYYYKIYTVDKAFNYSVETGIVGNVVVAQPNDAPVAVADAIMLAEGGTATTLVGGATSVLTNDTDTENNALTATVVTNPVNGTLTLNTDGTFSYVHNGSETTSDSFTYKANDGALDSNVVTVNITVTPVNDAPVAVADAITVAEGGTASTLVGGVTSVLANDLDPENNTLTATVVANPIHGALTLNPDGTFTYVHDGSETTSDSFTYKANDGTLESNVVTVSITISPVNDAPVAVVDAIIAQEGKTITILEGGATSVLTNDTDVDNFSLTATVVSTPVNGTLVLNSDGTFSYTHNGSATTSDSFTYKAYDGTLESNVVTVNITVVAVNDAPVAVADAITVAEGGTAGGNVLANDTDTENNVLTAIVLSTPTNGTLSLNTDGIFSYTHNGSETTSDSFTYKANDGVSDSNVVSVNIAVTEVNDAPVAISDAISVTSGGTVTTLNGGATSVLANDNDSENDMLTASLVSNVTNGILTLNTNGTFSYTHNGSSTTSDSFTYKVNDGILDSNLVTVTITISNEPSPTGLSYTTPNVFTKGTLITELNPTVGGGAVVSYSVTPALPSGLSLNTTTGVISGTPTAIAAATNYVVTATNTAGSTTATVSIMVNDTAPSGLSYTTPNVFTKGTAIAALNPTVSGGAVVSYSVNPGLPSGLSLNTTTGVISGTPTAIAAAANYVVTATNTAGSTTATVSIMVNDTAPSGLSYNTPNVFTKGTAITALNPTVSGGAVVSYSVTPALPSGLSLNMTTGVINGTPTAIAAAANYVVTATNTAGSTTATVSIMVNDTAPSGLSYTTPNVFTKGTAITALNPTVSGGVVVSYSVTPTLPSGLSLNTTTGVISGTPTAIAAAANYVVTATNTAGSTTATLSIRVNDTAPSGLSYNTPNVFTKGTAIPALNPTVSGGVVVSYSVNPALPSGLSLNTTTGVISGTPTAIAAAANYVVTATNTAGSTTATVSIRVNDTAPSGLSYTTPNVFTIGTAIPALNPTVSGGAVDSYSVNPALPAGLSLNTTTGVISGTPTAIAASGNYVVTATNTGGSKAFTISITVKDIAPASLSYTTPNVYTKGTAIAALNPTVTGGAVVSYSVSPALPTGLSLNTVTGVISGIPSAVTAVRNYVVTATNTGGSKTFTISITVKDIAPASLSYTTPNVYTKGTAIAALNPTVTGGAVVSYSVSPALPTGLSLNTVTGVISGIPSAVTAVRNYVVTATNTGGSKTFTVSITVKDIAPASLSYTTPNVYTKETAIAALNPTVTGGAVVSYSVNPVLPAGLSLNATTGVISGTPTVITATANYVVTATNTGGNTAATVSITVNDTAPTGLSYPTPNVFQKLVTISALNPAVSGGAVVSYSVSPALPSGLSLNTATGVISGTPTEVVGALDYSITATNSGGTSTSIISIKVDDVAPIALRYTTPNVYTKGTDIVALIPTISGGTPTTYTVSPSLPAGLILNTVTGEISGTPLTVTAEINYTVTAANAVGNTSAILSIRVDDQAPAGLSYPTLSVFKKGRAVEPIVPSISGGQVDTYTVSPSLPSGLRLNATTGVISGTAKVVTAPTDYIIKATNMGGSTSITVTIEVIDISLKVSQAFTPNGDGINDFWVIHNLAEYPNTIVRVFNTNGVQVFHSNQYQNNWDGHNEKNNQELPVGSYLFQIDLAGDGTIDNQGWLYIAK